MRPAIAPVVKAALVAVMAVSVLGATPGDSLAASSPLKAMQLVNGAALHHTFTLAGSTVAKSESLSKPDDITVLGADLFVGFQNGVGPQGEVSTDGNLDSTIVEFTAAGKVVGQWDVVGKADGVTADPALGGVFATVNEDAHSSLYFIKTTGSAAARVATKYAYSEALPHRGGTDAISVDGSQILISASAPGTTGKAAPQATYPAVYSVKLDASTKIAEVTPLFFDEATATNVTVGSSLYNKSQKLALTDPDSNEVVPSTSARFAGDFVLTSQGDKEQIYVSGVGTSSQKLSVLTLTQSVDDTAFPSSSSTRLFATDSTNDKVDVITGTFNTTDALVVVTPCGANGAPSVCPGAGYPANYLATLDLSTGVITKVAVTGAVFTPQGGLAP